MRLRNPYGAPFDKRGLASSPDLCGTSEIWEGPKLITVRIARGDNVPLPLENFSAPHSSCIGEVKEIQKG